MEQMGLYEPLYKTEIRAETGLDKAGRLTRTQYGCYTLVSHMSHHPAQSWKHLSNLFPTARWLRAVKRWPLSTKLSAVVISVK